MWLFRSGLVLLTYSLLNLYGGFRFFAFIRFFFPAFKAFVFWPPFIVFCYSMVLVYLLRLDRIQNLRHMAMYPMPVIFYFCMGLLVLDAALLALRFLGGISIPPVFYAARTGIALVFTVIVLAYGYFHAKDIKTVHYTVHLDKGGPDLSAGAPGPAAPGTPASGSQAPLRIALISDLHIGGTTDRPWLARMVDSTNAVNPDIILMAGDIFDNNISTMPDREEKAAELRRLSAPLGVYAVPGNHDVDRLSLRGGASTDLIREFLEKAGIVFMEDEVRLINDSFYLAGRRDIRPKGAPRSAKAPWNL